MMYAELSGPFLKNRSEPESRVSTEYRFQIGLNVERFQVVVEFEEEDKDPTHRAVEAFFQSLRENKEPLNNAEWGRLATLTCIMGRMAVEQKRLVKWSEVDV